MAGPVGQFKSDHHVVAGVTLLTVGIFGTIGSLTGRLPAMIAALFDPSALGTPSGSGTVPGIPGYSPTPETPALPGGGTPTVPGTPELPVAPEVPALPASTGVAGVLEEILSGL